MGETAEKRRRGSAHEAGCQRQVTTQTEPWTVKISQATEKKIPQYLQKWQGNQITPRNVKKQRAPKIWTEKPGAHSNPEFLWDLLL